MKNRLLLLLVLTLFSQLTFAQKKSGQSKQLVEALNKMIEGSKAISYFYNDSILYTDIDNNKRWLCDLEVFSNELIPAYRNTDFKITRGNVKNTYVINNACSRHTMLIDDIIYDEEYKYVDYKIRTVKETKKTGGSCYKVPYTKDISNPKANNAMENAIADIMKAFIEKNNELLNRYIHKEYKTVFLYKIGLPGRYSLIDTLDLNSNSVYLSYYEATEPYYRLTYDTAPVYDCGWAMWTKPGGLYCSKQGEGTLLRSNIQYYLDEEGADVNSPQIKSLIDREKRSRRVVLNYGDNNFIFSIIEIDGKWYLSILDCQDVDCSA